MAAVRGRRWWLCLCLPLLAACQPFNDARPMMDEYLERVARVLDLEPHYSPITPPRQMPRRRDRVLSMPELELGMLDFLSLYGCELQYVVGERNSIMGRVMQPANRLRYELRFIQAARTCMPTLADDDLRTVLAEAVASKRASLPLAVWNATWGTAEVETLFTLSKGDYPVAAEGNPVADLSREARQLDAAVARLLAGDLSVSLDFLDLVLQRWKRTTGPASCCSRQVDWSPGSTMPPPWYGSGWRGAHCASMVVPTQRRTLPAACFLKSTSAGFSRI